MVASSHSRPGTPSPAGSTPSGLKPDGSHTPVRSARPAPARAVRPRAAISIMERGLGPYPLLLPATAVIGALIIWPAIQIGLFSFQNYGLPQISGVLPAQWIGFSNYSQVL